MKKVLIVATVQSHVAQFHNATIGLLKEKGYIVHVAAKNNLREKETLKLAEVGKVFDVPFARFPLALANIKAYKQLKLILKQESYDIIYCHTPVGGVLSRLAGKKYRKKGLKIIYMSHGFHFYKGAPKKNWLIYYTIEKFMARHTDVLVTINKEDYALAKQKLKIPNIYHIDGVGVDFSRLQSEIDKRKLREQLGFTDDDFVLLSVGELNRNKNNIAVLQALNVLKNKNIKYLIAGNGPLAVELKSKVVEFELTDQVKFIGYTRDLAKYFYSANVFCFMSYREGLGLAAIEAMHCGLPILTSNKHGINDYSIDGETGYKCEPSDYLALSEAINRLYKNPKQCKMMGENNVAKADKYDVKIISHQIVEMIEQTINRGQ